MSVDVIVPVYRPNHKFDRLIKMLVKQTNRPNNIVILTLRYYLSSPRLLLRRELKKT